MWAVAARRGLVLTGVAALLGGVVLLGAVPGASADGSPRVDPDTPVTAMDHARGPANNSPTLVADPTDGRFVVMANRLDAPRFGCALQVSGDEGRTWVTAKPVPELPAGADTCYAPEAAFDAGGTLYYLFVGLQGTGNEPMGAFLTTSTDRARSFGPPRRVLGPHNYAVRMAMDSTRGSAGRLHLAWVHATSDPPLGGFGPPPNPILSSYSDDGGRTFSEPVQVSDRGRQRVVAPALFLGTGGAVHVAYYDLGADVRDYHGLEGPTYDGTWSIVLATSPDGGGRFARGVVVDDGVVPDERVMLVFTMPPPAAVAADGRLCLAWTDARHGDADAVLRCSTSGGRTWGGLRRLNDDARNNGRRQFLPRLGLAPGGRLDAVFYDRRDDPEDVLNHVSYTFSSDGARTFERNRRLTTAPSNSRIGQRYANVSAQGLVEFGSRLGLLSDDDAAVAAWADTRNSRGSTGQDVFSTVVEFAGPSPSAWTTVAGAVLVLGGVLALVAARRRRHRAGAEAEA